MIFGDVCQPSKQPDDVGWCGGFGAVVGTEGRGMLLLPIPFPRALLYLVVTTFCNGVRMSREKKVVLSKFPTS